MFRLGTFLSSRANTTIQLPRDIKILLLNILAGNKIIQKYICYEHYDVVKISSV